MKKLLFLLIILIIVCTGCMSGEYRVKVNKDGSGDLNCKILFDPAATGAGQYTVNSLSTALKENGFTVKSLKEGKLAGISAFKHVKKLDTIPVITGPGQYSPVFKNYPLTVKNGWFQTTYTFNQQIDLSGRQITERLLAPGKIKFILTLPVKAAWHNAPVSSAVGKSLEWEIVPGRNNSIQVKAKSWNLAHISITVTVMLVFIGTAIALSFRKKAGLSITNIMILAVLLGIFLGLAAVIYEQQRTKERNEKIRVSYFSTQNSVDQIFEQKS